MRYLSNIIHLNYLYCSGLTKLSLESLMLLEQGFHNLQLLNIKSLYN